MDKRELGTEWEAQKVPRDPHDVDWLDIDRHNARVGSSVRMVLNDDGTPVIPR